MDMSGKTAVVTGAGAGIGRGVALKFAGHGARVAAVDINFDTVRATAREIRGSGGAALAVQADVGDASSTDAAFEKILADFGTVDVLVNVAGIEHYQEFLEFTDQEFDRQIAVNLKSVFFCSRRAIPSMIRNGGGSIVNTASVQALATTGRIAPYAAAKGGILAMTRDLGQYNIRVNTICPGCIQTPMLDRSFTSNEDRDAYMERLVASLPLGRVGLPEDIANVALFLASPLSAYVTGTAINVDGGMMSKLPLPE
jgi:NAD(P)-dependent dehydrogenase (short-subunit alcohol dehydrogenase family)